MAKNMIKRKNIINPEKTRKRGKNESHHGNFWNLLYILATVYMSGNSLTILVQTQLGNYLYHFTLKTLSGLFSIYIFHIR